MTRIVAGKLGGRGLTVPPKGTRPTSERVREALFSRLDHLGVVRGAVVIDGYAGSGALGLEAISRGARRAVLVEKNAKAAAVCRTNVRSLGLGSQVEVVAGDVATYFAGAPIVGGADLIMLDPPYDVPGETLAGVVAAAAAWLAPDGILMVERAARSEPLAWDPQLEELPAKKYGDTLVHFLQLRLPEDAAEEAAPAGGSDSGAPATARD
ncbi:MAG: 16S rRNA (guanine(966)-N(2))-methyltransferase RsmD [Buchananella hordeovulneris]|nr:16S rRNA (guanine(966)-N(2))-methyltransferase RsmD [Buchananella hordeovulneris]